MADIVPIELTLDEREVFTLYAPRWRDASDEWEAFLGKDEDLYAFESVPDLVAFIRSNDDNDLADHPAWDTLTSASAHRLDPRDDKRFDLISVYDLLAEKPTQESVEELAGTLAIASAIGSVCELPAISKFFNGNPVLSTVSGGIACTGPAGAAGCNAVCGEPTGASGAGTVSGAGLGMLGCTFSTFGGADARAFGCTALSRGAAR